MPKPFREGRADKIIGDYIDSLATRIQEFRDSDFYSVGSGSVSASGDFDGDGKQDIVFFLFEKNDQTGVTSGPTLGQMVFLRGRGDGTFKDATSTLVDDGVFNAYVRKLRIGDFNGDGIDDIVVACNREDGRFADANEQTAPQVAFLSNGRTLVKQDLDFNTWGHGLSAGDLNSDGRADFFISGFVGDPDGTGAAFFIQELDGTLTRYFSETVQGTATAIGDFDGDGTSEMVDVRTIYENGLPAATGLAELEFDGTDLVETAFHADGEIKRLLTAPGWNTNEAVYIIREDSTGTEYADGGLQDLQVGDINGDGVDDLVGIRFGGSLVYDENGIYDYRQSVSMEHFEFFTLGADGKLELAQYKVEGWTPTPYGVLDYQLVDLDADGHLDIFIGSGTTTNGDFVGPQMLLNDGTGNFYVVPEEKMPIFANNGWVQGIPVDANSDGIMDIYYATPAGTSDWDGWKSNTDHIFLGTQHSLAGPGFIDPASKGAPGFNEHYYLNEYSDVAALVEDGTYDSGLEHFLDIGRAEGRFGFAAGTTVWATAKQDTVLLREGDETVFALEGNDKVRGGLGADILFGGKGADRFIYASSAESLLDASDLIGDFKHNSDKVDLKALDAVEATSTNDAFRFFDSRHALSGVAGELIVSYAKDSGKDVTVLQGDTDGDKLADIEIHMSGHLRIDSGDLML